MVQIMAFMLPLHVFLFERVFAASLRFIDGLFFSGTEKAKRPYSTQPFIPGLQGFCLTLMHTPSTSCGHPHALDISDPAFFQYLSKFYASQSFCSKHCAITPLVPGASVSSCVVSEWFHPVVRIDNIGDIERHGW